MSRALSVTVMGAVNARESGEVLVVLLTISHADFDATLRLCSNPTTLSTNEPLVYGTTSRSNFYTFLPMEVLLPDDKDDAPPAARVTISNVDLSMIPAVRSVTTPPSVLVEVVRAATPNTVEIAFPPLRLTSVEGDAASLTLSMTVDAMMAEPYPGDLLTPQFFAGLF